MSLSAKIIVSAMHGIKKTGLIKGPDADPDEVLKSALTDMITEKAEKE